MIRKFLNSIAAFHGRQLATGRLSYYVILFTAAAILLFFTAVQWRGDNPKSIIYSDGKGYYLYLPAIFIYHDFQYKFMADYEKRYYKPSANFYIENEVDGKLVNKYFAGIALMLLPFFAGAYLLSALLHFPLDGYSLIFQCAVSVASLFYLCLGLYYLRKTLILYKIPDRITALSLFLFVWGTNLFYYAAIEPGMAHVYAFAAVSCFIFYSKRLFSSGDLKHLIPLAVALTLVLLIRPSNGLVIAAIPFLAGDIKYIKSLLLKMFKKPLPVMAFVLIIAGGVFLQLFLYYLQTGRFFIWAYGDATFNFKKPEIINVLFSYHKGLFVYTPLTLLALCGFIALFRKSFYEGFTLLFFLAATTYVISSWYMWCYGGSYGMRPFVDYYPFFSILFALLVYNTRNLIFRAFILAGALLCLGLNIIQTYQKYIFILPWDDMTKEKYWAIFLHTDKSYVGAFIDDSPADPVSGVIKIISFSNDFDPGEPWYDLGSVTDQKAHSGKYASKIGSSIHKSVSFIKPVREITKSKNVYVKATFWVFVEDAASNAMITISFENKGRSYSWSPFYLVPARVVPGRWEHVSVGCRMPELQSPEDLVSIYVFNEDNKTVFIDDYLLEFMELEK